MDINAITNRTILRILTVIAAFAGGLWLVSSLRQPITWIVIALFLAVALDPAVKHIAKIIPGRRRGPAAGIVFIALVILITTIALTLVPPFVKQTTTLINDLPGLSGRFQQSSNPIIRSLSESDFVKEWSNLNPEEVAPHLFKAGSVGSLLQGLGGGLVAMLATLTLTFFMILEGPRWIGTLERLVPKELVEHRRHLAHQMYRVITGYVTGRLLLGASVGITSYIFLSLAGIPYALPLGILAGLLDLIPLIGATTGGVVVTLAAIFFSSFGAGLVVGGLYLAYQQFENHVLMPLVDSRTVKLSPLAVFIAGILGVWSAGFLGALMAVPVAACAQILVKDFIKNRQMYQL